MTVSLDKYPLEIRQAKSLLFPTVALLGISGLTQRAIENGVSLAYKRIHKNFKGRKIKRIGDSTRYTDIITRWTCDKRFLDAQGRPKPLKLIGKAGFTALVRSVMPGAKPLDVLAVLKNFKTIRATKNGQYELIKPFFISSTPESLALEPTFHFLTDATTTLSRILTRTKQSRGPDVFWRNVDNAYLSAHAAKQFLAFTRERSLSFLEELNDWLVAHSQEKARRRNRYHRVGLGIFSIHSPPRLGRS